MTEHERRINDKDIKAYENMDNKMYSYLPGFKSTETTLQDKYINKLFSNGQAVDPNPQANYFNYSGAVPQGASKRQVH